jgi:branched-chain amino acid transport system substrate-binding protein
MTLKIKPVLALLAASLSMTIAAAQTLKIGVIAPLTGGGAPWGLAAAEGPRILAEEINAKGGLAVGAKKYKVEVIAYDDQYKAADAVAAYNRLVNQDGVKHMIVLGSAATMALKQQIEDDKVVVMTASYTGKALDKSSHYLFRLYSPPDDYIGSFVAWMKDNVKGKRIVIVNPNDETGWDQTQLAMHVFKANGFEVLGSELFERAQKDFQPMLTKIIAQKPDIVELGGTSPATAGLIIRQARELGYDKLFSKTGGAGPKDIVASAGAKAAEGTINMLYADPANEGYKRLAAAYRKARNQEPNEIIVSFYDGANVLLNAIQKAGTVDDTAKVAAAFSKALPMKSVQGDELTIGGKATYGVDAQVMSVNYIGTIRNGEPVVLGKTK